MNLEGKEFLDTHTGILVRVCGSNPNGIIVASSLYVSQPRNESKPGDGTWEIPYSELNGRLAQHRERALNIGLIGSDRNNLDYLLKEGWTVKYIAGGDKMLTVIVSGLEFPKFE